ncbi:MAG TPA: hypothetical protein VK665_09515, partial [Candidatus Elarobacter sp.]|nr:hypothetical protein [Candidatus Elarobacter sp.]
MLAEQQSPNRDDSACECFCFGEPVRLKKYKCEVPRNIRHADVVLAAVCLNDRQRTAKELLRLIETVFLAQNRAEVRYVDRERCAIRATGT